MKRLILQSPESEKQKGFTPSWKMILPTDDPCQIYPRVSTPEQKKNVSALMQQDKSFALKCGWVDDGRIIMDTQDLGISGRLPMDKRPAFLGMLRRIEEGKIKAVIASQEDRLFRDKWGREYSKFMEICYIYGVLVITPDFVYDFSIDWHIDRFRRRCEEAWNYMQRHIYDRVIAAKHELARMGRWSGFAIATGYTVDLEEKRDGKKNPDYLKTIPYERHMEGIRWVYGLYKEKGGNMREVWNELMRHPIHFPPDEPNIPGAKQRKLKKVLDKDGNLIGYRIGSISGLRYILSNPIYAGYWVYQNVIISSENHTPIVDFGTFLYAFNRLSPVYLDGKPNEEYEMRRHKYAKRHDLERRTLLKNCIESGDEGYTINVKSDSTRPATTTGYAFYPKTSGPRGAEYSVNAKELDTIFIGKLIEKLQSANGYDDFLNEEEAEATARLQAIKDTELQIRTIKSLMKQIKEQIATGVLTNPRLLQKANESYNGYEQELNQYEMTLKELQGGTSQATQRRTYQQLMQEAGEDWEEVVSPEDMPILIETFVEKVVLTNLSPRFYKVTIYWRDPEWQIHSAVCFRWTVPSPNWTDEEKAIIEAYGATASRKELIELMPNRSWKGIRKYLNRHIAKNVDRRRTELKRDKRSFEEEGLIHDLCIRDLEVMRQYSIEYEEIKSIEKKYNETGENFAKWS